MKTKLLLVAVTLVFFANAGSSFGCGYGLFDPDVELACSGDPIQGPAAFQRVIRRGKGAMREIEFYRRNALRMQKSYTTYLARLRSGDPTLKMTFEQRATEIERAGKQLEWNTERLKKLDLMIFLTEARDFAMQSWKAWSRNSG